MFCLKDHSTLLCFDYGLKKIGVAVARAPIYLSVPSHTIATPTTLDKTVNALLNTIRSHQADCVVLGNPTHLNASKPSHMQEHIYHLQQALQSHTTIPVILWDERLSSAQADKLLKKDNHMRRKQRKTKIDALAAHIILSSFIDAHLLY